MWPLPKDSEHVMCKVLDWLWHQWLWSSSGSVVGSGSGSSCAVYLLLISTGNVSVLCFLSRHAVGATWMMAPWSRLTASMIKQQIGSQWRLTSCMRTPLLQVPQTETSVEVTLMMFIDREMVISCVNVFLFVLQATIPGETHPMAPGSCSPSVRCFSVTGESWSWCRSWPGSTAKWHCTLSPPPTYLGLVARSRSLASPPCWLKTSTFLPRL